MTEQEAIEKMIRDENERLKKQVEEEWRMEREVMERIKREEEDNKEMKGMRKKVMMMKC